MNNMQGSGRSQTLMGYKPQYTGCYDAVSTGEAVKF